MSGETDRALCVDMSQGRWLGDDIGLPLAGVTQTLGHREIDGIPGDCLRAAVASIFGMDPADVPHFATYGEGMEPPDKHGWWWALVGFCATLEPPYDVLVVEEPPAPSESPADLFGCYLLSGKSPRGDWNHVVVARGGQVIWDPHPSRDGIDGEPVELNYLVRREATDD